MVVGDEDLHVWRANLRVARSRVDTFSKLLSVQETATARRYRFCQDRHDFVVRRGILKSLLGRYLDADPSGLTITNDAYGKPYLEAAGNRSSLHFSLSHSKGLALYVFTTGREVGVDVEWIDPRMATETVVQEIYSDNEIARFRRLPVERRRRQFFRSWVCKEAIAKAGGRGLAYPIKRIEIAFAPDAAATVVGLPAELSGVDEWSVSEIATGPDHVAAAAVKRPKNNVSCWDWSWAGP